MRLRFDLGKCSGCTSRECMEACPNRLDFHSLGCRNCRPERADCAAACPKNAFFETAEGILAIDREKCSGCGKCAQACKQKAISVRNGKAAKCDFCASNDFMVACAEACGWQSIAVERSEREIRAAEKALGWRVFRPAGAIKRTLLEGERFKVAEFARGEKWYLLQEFPELSKEEAVLLGEIIEEFRSDAGSAKDGIAQAMEKFLEKNLVALDERQKQYFLSIIFSQVNGFGPISLLLEDDSLEEIALTGAGRNFPLRVFHRLHGWCRCNAYFYDRKSVVNAVNRMLLKTDRRLSLANPKVNGVLPDGSRLNATIPPVSFRQPSFTIRKFNAKKFTPFELVKNRTFSRELMAFLWLALETDCSLLVVGNTGSGKTTTLNALFSFVPENERIVLVEETPELQVPHSHVVRLNTCPERGIGMSDLIVDSLRMRPDRIAVGEVRSSEEVNAFIDTLLAGQGKGSYASFHAGSAEEALKRLELLGVKKMDLCSIDLLLVQKRWDRIHSGKRTEMRRVTEAAEVLEKNAEPGLNTLFEFDYAKEKIRKKNESTRVKRKIRKAFALSEKGFERELGRRTRVLERGVIG